MAFDSWCQEVGFGMVLVASTHVYTWDSILEDSFVVGDKCGSVSYA